MFGTPLRCGVPKRLLKSPVEVVIILTYSRYSIEINGSVFELQYTIRLYSPKTVSQMKLHLSKSLLLCFIISAYAPLPRACAQSVPARISLVVMEGEGA